MFNLIFIIPILLNKILLTILILFISTSFKLMIRLLLNYVFNNSLSGIFTYYGYIYFIQSISSLFGASIISQSNGF